MATGTTEPVTMTVGPPDQAWTPSPGGPARPPGGRWTRTWVRLAGLVVGAVVVVAVVVAVRAALDGEPVVTTLADVEVADVPAGPVAQRWSLPLGNAGSQAGMVDGLVVVAEQELPEGDMRPEPTVMHLRALDALTGEPVWSRDVGPGTSVAVVGDHGVVGFWAIGLRDARQVAAIAAADGTDLWDSHGWYGGIVGDAVLLNDLTNDPGMDPTDGSCRLVDADSGTELVAHPGARCAGAGDHLVVLSPDGWQLRSPDDEVVVDEQDPADWVEVRPRADGGWVAIIQHDAGTGSPTSLVAAWDRSGTRQWRMDVDRSLFDVVHLPGSVTLVTMDPNADSSLEPDGSLVAVAPDGQVQDPPAWVTSTSPMGSTIGPVQRLDDRWTVFTLNIANGTLELRDTRSHDVVAWSDTSEVLGAVDPDGIRATPTRHGPLILPTTPQSDPRVTLLDWDLQERWSVQLEGSQAWTRVVGTTDVAVVFDLVANDGEQLLVGYS